MSSRQISPFTSNHRLGLAEERRCRPANAKWRAFLSSGSPDTPADDMVDALLAGDEDLCSVLDPVAELVTTYTQDRFEAVASVDPAFWDGLVKVATYQLQQNLGRVFDVETAEPVLRFGFVLRALDEALRLAWAPEPHP